MYLASLIIAVISILALPGDALAWGPATHVFLSGSLLGGAVTGLSPLLLRFLRRHRRDFYEGGVWADVLVAKKHAFQADHCHSWQVGQSLLDRARQDRQQAFALGYLCHLAADTVAHGHFVPRKLLLTRLPENLGHLYWELRADGLLERDWWYQVELRVAEVSEGNRELLEGVLEPTLFSFDANKFLFEGQLASYRLDSWYRLVALAERNARLPLAGERIEAYQRESLNRMVQILQDPADPMLVDLDPTGGLQMRRSVETRRSLRRLIRTGDLAADALHRVAHDLAGQLTLKP
jgi:hypothetical protein